MLRIPHYLDNWLTDGSEVVSYTCRPLSTPRKFFLFCLFLLEAEGLVWLEGLGKLKKIHWPLVFKMWHELKIGDES
jgi:hypothetical protein